MKKIFIICMIMMVGTCMVFAGPRNGGHSNRGGNRSNYRSSYHHSGCHHHHGGSHHHHHHGGGGSSGVRLAADIVGLVGASLDLIAPRNVVVESPAPVYTAPVPVYHQPTYSDIAPVYTSTGSVYTPVRPPTIVYQPSYR